MYRSHKHTLWWDDSTDCMHYMSIFVVLRPKVAQQMPTYHPTANPWIIAIDWSQLIRSQIASKMSKVSNCIEELKWAMKIFEGYLSWELQLGPSYRLYCNSSHIWPALHFLWLISDNWYDPIALSCPWYHIDFTCTCDTISHNKRPHNRVSK